MIFQGFFSKTNHYPKALVFFYYIMIYTIACNETKGGLSMKTGLKRLLFVLPFLLLAIVALVLAYIR